MESNKHGGNGRLERERERERERDKERDERQETKKRKLQTSKEQGCQTEQDCSQLEINMILFKFSAQTKFTSISDISKSQFCPVR